MKIIPTGLRCQYQPRTCRSRCAGRNSRIRISRRDCTAEIPAIRLCGHERGFADNTGMRPVGTPEQLTDRRRKAITLLQQRHRVNETAWLVGVTPGAIIQWRQTYEQQGEAFFESHSPPGRACCLSEKQIDQLKRRLLKGAGHNGYPTELWTLRRIAEVIEKHFGITCDPSSVWHILQRMGWSCQKPEKQARERDEEAISGWRQNGWPRIKKARRTHKTIVFLDESGFMLQPTVRRTWAQKVKRQSCTVGIAGIVCRLSRP